MIGIVVINYKTWEMTINCIESIRNNCTIDYKVYVVDNCSPNESLNELLRLYGTSKDVDIIASEINGGYGFGLNKGIERALTDGCEAIIASNNDILYKKNSIENLSKALKTHNNVVIVGAQQLSPEGKKQTSATKRAYGRVDFMFWYFPFRYHLSVFRRIEDFAMKHITNPCEIAFPLGGCYMISAEFLKGKKLYDERIFMYSEEDIIGYKIREERKKAILCPNAYVIHKHGATTGNKKTDYLLRSVPNKKYYCEKYLKMSKAEIFVHCLLYRTNINLKCIYNREFRNNRKRLLEAIDT